MKNFLLLILVLGSSGVCANTTFLDCNVRGTISSSFENKNLRDSRVTVEISEHGKDYLYIGIEGEDDYLASSNTVKSPTIDFVNYSNSSKYDLTSTWNIPNGNIKTYTTKITINRLSGHLTVSKSSRFRNGNFIDISYSGNCSKVTGKKF